MGSTALRLLLAALFVAGCGARTVLREPTDAADTADAADGFTPVDVPIVPADVPITPVDVPPSCADFQTLCNGRCVDTRNDNSNCGACGLACADSACVNGACRMTPCVRPTSLCGVRCVDLTSDPSNCGLCNRACAAGQLCVAGGCFSDCGGPGRTLCSGACRDLTTDRSNCGACGNVCGPAQVCSGGRCFTDCGGPGRTLCGMTCVDLSTDRSNCGACGLTCGFSQTCSGGSCVTDCGGVGRTLCGPACVDLRTDPRNCGSCGLACLPGTLCTGGTCSRPVMGTSFRIGILSPDACRVIDHDMVTGDDRGGIALSRESVFYSGDEALGRFDIDTLAPSVAGRVDDGLVSDLATGQVYSLRQRGMPVMPGGFAEVTELAPLDGRTGTPLGMLLRLSSPVTLSGSQVGIFSGLGRAVLSDGTRVYNVDLPSGAVTFLGSLPAPLPAVRCESWAFWGVAELTDGAIWLAYVRNGQTIARTRVPDGETGTVATFRNLSDMCSFTVSPDRGRWYWHHEGSSQFGDRQESVGYCPARFF